MEVLVIKNMVCPRCTAAVERIFTAHNLPGARVSLGKVELEEKLPDHARREIQQDLQAAGFELLDDPKARLVSEIKRLVIRRVRTMNGPPDETFSRYLAEELARDFNGISRLFSSVEGITLERYILIVKTEFVKELLIYGEYNLAEIAFRLDYSSSAHLSSQFKKETGMTPTAFRQMTNPVRKPLDKL